VEESKNDWLMMLDSDVLPPPGFEHKLLTHMKNNPQIRMVGGWYKLKDGSDLPVVYHEDKMDDRGVMQYVKYTKKEIGRGLEMVDAAGAGVWLMSREVAEAIGPKPYDMSAGGEDLALCRKVRDAGYSLWIDWRIACAHAGVAVA
jgi:GT2 family glycosyltransferase